MARKIDITRTSTTNPSFSPVSANSNNMLKNLPTRYNATNMPPIKPIVCKVFFT